MKALLAFALFAQLSCSVNSYCIGCEVGDGGGDDSAVHDAAHDGGDTTDAGPCVPSGPEICDGKDNDCDGQIDNGTLPGVGDPCTNQTGECAGGVQQCVAGHLTCTKNPTPEICDGKDNDCNGLVDEGDPGGGAACGTSGGQCHQGTNHCTNGTVQCFGAIGPTPETCNALDDDCDGKIDEDLTMLGSCGISNVGACKFGQLACAGGTTSCTGAVNPSFELCNGIDDDCDGKTDEGFDLQADAQNCGTCGHACGAGLPANGHAVWTCTAGGCAIASCQAGYHDNNNSAADGCEMGPCFITGVEVCDGIDNDCDGNIDEDLGPPPAICATQGECLGTVATCAHVAGWRCDYGATVSTDANGNIVPETKCDGLDNDCNGTIDDNQPNTTGGGTRPPTACHDSALGACERFGTFTCDAANLNGPAVCAYTSGGATPTAEICNGLDDDCDGIVDEQATDSMVDVRDPSGTLLFHIDTYEASRPDASASSVGTLSNRSCSRAGVLPWASVTETQAAAACTAAGKRLCTAAEWQLACAGNAGLAYPYGNTYQPNSCNGNDYDPDCTPPDTDLELPTGSAYGCPTKPAQSVCVSPTGAFDMSGNLKEWTSTQVQPGAFGIRGGGYDTPSNGLACQFSFVSADPSFLFANLGFRCCEDPP